MDSAVPSDVAPAVAGAARDTFGGATSVAALLPDGVLDAAQIAFAGGLNVVAGVAVVVMAGMAGVTAVVLRHVDARAQEPAPAEALRPTLVAEPA